jgi:hypothetical protein
MDAGWVGDEKFMKQKLDELRTLAVNLFEAGQREKRAQPPSIWSNGDLQFRDLPSESVKYWDAIAAEAYKRLRGKSK